MRSVGLDQRRSGDYHQRQVYVVKSRGVAHSHEVPEPLRKIVGDLSLTEKVLVGLDLKPRG